MAANSSHPRLLTRPAYAELETQTPSDPRFTHTPLLLALGVSQALAVLADVGQALAVLADVGQALAVLADVAGSAAEDEDLAAGAALEGAAGAALEGAASGAGVGSALPARIPPLPEPAPGFCPLPESSRAPAPCPALPGTPVAGSDPVPGSRPAEPGSVVPAGDEAPVRVFSGKLAAAPANGGGPETRGGWMTRMDAADRARKAIAPAETTMTGTVLPAGWERKTAPAHPILVRTRSTARARASCSAGSRGP
jgi:hypothetical protein